MYFMVSLVGYVTNYKTVRTSLALIFTEQNWMAFFETN